jgi:exopolysaccharide production protein ExoZ
VTSAPSSVHISAELPADAAPAVFYNLQALRAYAAINVAVFHFALIPASSVPWHYGSFGVDLFFVLSGFIIAWSTRAGHRHFLINRAIRVLPAYWIATCLFGLLLLLAMPADDALGWIGRSLLFLYGPDGRPPILFVGWTLVYELVFYLVYAVALRAGWRRAPIAAIVALFALAYGGRLTGITPRDWPLLVEFAFGLAIFLWVDRTSAPLHLAVSMVLVGAGAILLFVFEPSLHGQVGMAADQMRVARLGLPAAAVVLGLVQIERADMAARSRFVLALGAASYALYLLHPLVFSFVLPFPAGPLALRFVIFTALLAVTIGVSLSFHAWVELPVLRVLRRNLTGGPGHSSKEQ